MLTREALEQSLPLTEQLDDRNLFLQPIAGTPLAALVTATRADAKFNVPLDGGGYQPDLENIEFIANVKPQDGRANEHDASMDAVVEVAARAVQDHVHFAKNVVAPAVDDLVQKVNQGLAAISPSSLLGMEVRVYELPLPLKGAIEAGVRRYADAPNDSPAMNVRMPDLAASDIVALFGKGDGLADWLSAKGESWLLALWEGVFQVKPGAGSGKSFRDWIDNREDGVDNALAIFLLAKKLLQDTPEGVEMQARAMEQSLVAYRNQAAARCCRALDEVAFAEKAGTLVRSVAGPLTWVNGTVYRQWIEAGGQNEVLFGNALARPQAFTVAAINERATELQSSWNRHAAVTATVEANRRFTRTKQLLASSFEEQIGEVAEGDASLAGDKASVYKAFLEELECVREDELKDLYACVLKLLCRSRFCHTESERILSGIERVKRENPALDVREAAALSVMDYIAWWVATQFKVYAL